MSKAVLYLIPGTFEPVVIATRYGYVELTNTASPGNAADYLGKVAVIFQPKICVSKFRFFKLQRAVFLYRPFFMTFSFIQNKSG